MRLLHIFVYGTLYFTNLCVQENDVVAVGKYDLQCGDYRNILKAPSKVTKIKLLKNVEALYSVTSEKAASVDLLLTAPLEIQLPEIFLPFNYTTFNRGAPISIEPYILFPKLMEDYQTQWSCLLEDTLLYVCQAQINEEFYVETGFNQEGNYTITILVAAGNVEVTATCHIIVALDVPSIEFFIPYPLKPDREIEITARISELRTY
ncbi:hypothetical protein YQE_12664, partial [Dendroctonus ponderosae]